MRVLLQRFHVRAALRELKRNPQYEEAATGVLNTRVLFNTYYTAAVDEYIATHENAVSSLDEEGNPILTKILEFIKWMYDSGFLEFLLEMFFKLPMPSSNEEVHPLTLSVNLGEITITNQEEYE